MSRLDIMISRAEQVLADQKLTVQQKNIRLSGMMTDMEHTYRIPAMHNPEFEQEHPELMKTYRKISNMRSL